MESNMHASESLMKLVYEWEIQLVVLLSFTLQMFLFFTGSHRRHSTKRFLRLFIWIAYLGADLVAVYALGYLSRHEDITMGRNIIRTTQPLAFFWAPFLLIHLGGQDTITAFAMEDNNLWLRHLLNLVLQVVLALYVFWKSIGRQNMELLVSGVFVFIAGIIKYGERTWSLKCGSLATLESSTGHQYKQRLPEILDGDAGYANIVCASMHSMQNVLNVFARRNLLAESRRLPDEVLQDPNKLLKVVELQLAMMYDDIYTKAIVLRTRKGIILRCLSHISVMAAFTFLLASDKGRYHIADTAITYALFVGCFFLEICAIFIFVMSPWTWAWLKARKCNKLARLSWFLLSSDIGWPEKKPRLSHLMGQYNYVSNWLTDDQHPRSPHHRVMKLVTRLVNLAGAKKECIFWMSKLLHTEYVEADKMTMECVVKGITQLKGEFISGVPRKWPILGPILEENRSLLLRDFGACIIHMHALTELHCSAAAKTTGTMDNVMVDVCRKLSNYVVYLLVTQPSMLPLNASATATLQVLLNDSQRNLTTLNADYNPEPGKEALEEMVDMWTRLLLYAAGKSRSEMHAAQLRRGGELITFAWLLMAQDYLGESEFRRIRITNSTGESSVNEVFAFYLAAPSSSSPAAAPRPGNELH